MTTATIESAVEGEYILKVHSPRGDREYRFKNLILDAGLDRLFSPASVWGHVQIGTGTAPPANTDTALQARVASTTTVQTAAANAYTAGPPDYITTTVTYRFALGALNGNFSEVGIGWAAAGSLWSRALITNSGGTPITLTVLSDEQLDVTYLVHTYPQQADATGNIILDGVSYAYTLRPAGVSTFFNQPAWHCSSLYASQGMGGVIQRITTYSGAIGGRTAGPTSASGSASSTVAQTAYVAGSFERTFQHTADLNQGNAAGGIRSVVFDYLDASNWSAQSFQVQFTPVIPKTASQRLRLDIKRRVVRRP